MTQNEVSIIKNAVIDATEAYVEARLGVLDFVKTQIGVVTAKPTQGSDGKYRHTVKCNATSGSNGIIYNNVLSIGNIPLPADSVVFLIAPNAQYSNQFILGKLDTTPAHIIGGSIELGTVLELSDSGGYIRLGGNDASDAPIYLTSTSYSSYGDDVYGHMGGFYVTPTGLRLGNINSSRAPVYLTSTAYNYSGTQVYGHLGGFYIATDGLRIHGNQGGNSIITGTKVQISQWKQVSSSVGFRHAMIMDTDNARIAVNTDGNPDGGLIASDAAGWDSDDNYKDPLSGDNYIKIYPRGIDYNIEDESGSIGVGSLEFLNANQDFLRRILIGLSDSGITFTGIGFGSVTIPWG